jgi:hypothetical protein
LAVIRVRGWNVRNIVSVLRVRDAKLTPSADRFQSFARSRLGELARQRECRQPAMITKRLPNDDRLGTEGGEMTARRPAVATRAARHSSGRGKEIEYRR